MREIVRMNRSLQLPKNPNKGVDYHNVPTRVIYLAGGCFWGVEAYFSHVYGVKATKTGYANGKTENPGYYDIKHTGHVEAVRVEYDFARVTLESLLTRFFAIIDSTLLNRQGGDIGTQYRTGIYYEDEGDLPVIDAALEREPRDRAVHRAGVEMAHPEPARHGLGHRGFAARRRAVYRDYHRPLPVRCRARGF